MDITKLPCGLVVDLDSGDCCRRSCPNERMRRCDTRRRSNPIERCYNRHKAAEYEQKAEKTDGAAALELYRAVCRLTRHQWTPLGGGLLQCERCGVVKREKPEEPEQTTTDG